MIAVNIYLYIYILEKLVTKIHQIYKKYIN